VPVEVIPMAVAPVMRHLRALRGDPAIRMAERKDGPVISDEGNLIVDVRFERIDDPPALEREINLIPGVLENGLFCGLADLVLVGVAGTREVRRLS
jgi:ribose 5-phosphate isomerase A